MYSVDKLYPNDITSRCLMDCSNDDHNSEQNLLSIANGISRISRRKIWSTCFVLSQNIIIKEILADVVHHYHEVRRLKYCRRLT